MTANWPDAHHATIVRYFHFVASLQRHREAGKVCHVRKHGRGNAVLGKEHLTQSRFTQKFFQFANDYAVSVQR